MTPKKRPFSTACAVPEIPDPARMNAPLAERCVLCGLMREPAATRAGIVAKGFTKGDLYYAMHQELFDVQMYLLNGCGTADLVEVYDELRLRKRQAQCGTTTWLGFASHNDCAKFLIDVWTCLPHVRDVRDWADPDDRNDFYAWAALAGVNKVMHLAARRQAIHAANELIRDALNPTGGADYLNGRIDQLDEEY